ncbi:MAG: hypothetical protein NTU93_00090 [Arthrobacter sp.]|nr:hypothetical protein [Arthrobacter sp.]
MTRMTRTEEIERIAVDFRVLCTRLQEMEEKMQRVAVAYNRMHEMIPASLPDGTGMMTDEQWIGWAVKMLGYPEGGEPF